MKKLFLYLICSISYQLIAQQYGDYTVQTNKLGLYDLYVAGNAKPISINWNEINILASKEVMEDGRYLLCSSDKKKEIIHIASKKVILSEKSAGIELNAISPITGKEPNREENVILNQPEYITVFTDKHGFILNTKLEKVIFQSDTNAFQLEQTPVNGQLLISDYLGFWSKLISVEGSKIIDGMAYIGESDNGQYMVRKDFLYGLYDSKGRAVVAPQYTHISSPKNSKGFYIVEKDDAKTGVIDHTGKVRIPFEYAASKVSEFYWSSRINTIIHDLFFLYLPNNGGLVILDSTGTAITSEKFGAIDHHFEHLRFVIVRNGDKDGVFDTETRKLTVPVLYELDDVLGSSYLVNDEHCIGGLKDGKWGMVDMITGEVRIPFEYGKTCFVGKNKMHFHNEETISGYYDWASCLILEKDGLFGIVDTHNKILQPFEFETVEIAPPYEKFNQVIKLKRAGLYGLVLIKKPDYWVAPTEYSSILFNGKLSKYVDNKTVGFTLTDDYKVVPQ